MRAAAGGKLCTREGEVSQEKKSAKDMALMGVEGNANIRLTASGMRANRTGSRCVGGGAGGHCVACLAGLRKRVHENT